MMGIEKDNDKNGIDIMDLFFLLIQKRKFIIVFTSIFTIVGVFYAFLAPAYYKGEISLYMNEKEGVGNSQIMQMAAQFGLGGFSNNSEIYNISDIVKSHNFVKKIFLKKWYSEKLKKEVSLEEYYDIFKKSKAKNHLSKQDLKMWKYHKLNKYIREFILSNITIVKNHESGLMKISILTREAKLSKNIANYIADAIEKDINSFQKIKREKKRLYIESRLIIAKNDLIKIENDMTAFRVKNRSFSSSPELQLEFERLNMQYRIQQELYLTLRKQNELALIEENKNNSIITILDKSIIAEKPFKPNKIFVIISSFIFSFIFSIGCIFSHLAFTFVKGKVK